jgi:hypothetical protein
MGLGSPIDLAEGSDLGFRLERFLGFPSGTGEVMVLRVESGIQT